MFLNRRPPPGYLRLPNGLLLPGAMGVNPLGRFGVCGGGYPGCCQPPKPSVPCDYCANGKFPEYMRVAVEAVDVLASGSGCGCCREFNQNFHVTSADCDNPITWNLIEDPISPDGKGPCFALSGSSKLLIESIGGDQYRVSVIFTGTQTGLPTFSKVYDGKPNCLAFSGEELTTKSSTQCDVTNATCKLTALSAPGDIPTLNDSCCGIADIDYFAVTVPSAGSCSSAGNYICDEDADSGNVCWRYCIAAPWKVDARIGGASSSWYALAILSSSGSPPHQYAVWMNTYGSLAALRTALAGQITLAFYSTGGTCNYTGTTATLTLVQP